MNLDMFLLHNAGLQDTVQQELSHLACMMHPIIAIGRDEQNDPYLDKEI